VKQFTGMAIGGPKKGMWLGNCDPVILLARMARNVRNFHPEENLRWIEVDRGRYEWEAGHWWWKGWGKQP